MAPLHQFGHEIRLCLSGIEPAKKENCKGQGGLADLGAGVGVDLEAYGNLDDDGTLPDFHSKLLRLLGPQHLARRPAFVGIGMPLGEPRLHHALDVIHGGDAASAASRPDAALPRLGLAERAGHGEGANGHLTVLSALPSGICGHGFENKGPAHMRAELFGRPQRFA